MHPTNAPAPQIRATVPVLASLDLDTTLAFYCDRLGFAERHIAENTSCYVRGDTQALHADFQARGLPLAAPVVREWGMRELYVIDPHGNLVKFGEPV